MKNTPPGLRATRQRSVIREEIKKTVAHPTADELYHCVRRKLRRISLGTVYRNLERLSAAGDIQKLEVGGEQKRFDGRTDQHYHVFCVSCGRLADLGIKPLGELKKVRRAGSFAVTGYRLEFFGLCPKCRLKARAK